MFFKHLVPAIALLFTLPLVSNQLYASDVSLPNEANSIWLEGESPSTSNFVTGVAPSQVTKASPSTSGAAYLTLASGFPVEGDLPFYATYTFKVRSSGVYKVWLASTQQDAGWTSPLSIKINNLPPKSLENRVWATGKYGTPPRDVFGWTSAGTFDFQEGANVLRVEAVRVRNPADKLYVAMIDAILITDDLEYKPTGHDPKYSTQPPWHTALGEKTPEQFQKDLEIPIYRNLLKQFRETSGEPGEEQEILDKLMARPLPSTETRQKAPHAFGVHGMEEPYVRIGIDTEKVQRAYELLARVGVDSFRTAASCWHRLGENYDDFRELDYQVESAAKYGMTQLMVVGYPTTSHTVGDGLSAAKPEYHSKYRDYLNKLLQRYGNKGLIRSVELGNEVDALSPWWIDGTPEMYVAEMKLLKEAVTANDPSIEILGFAATYARSEELGGNTGGRAFVRRAFDLGIDQLVDAYSLHYTWPLKERDFPEFFRQEQIKRGFPTKPLTNTEEVGYGRASDIIKLFARNLFVHGMKDVYYFCARDLFEHGSLVSGGLFDLEWNPKPRLLAYAAAVDGMKNRKLVGMAEPAAGVEAYILEDDGATGVENAKYSVVLWRNGKDIQENLDIRPMFGKEKSISVSGWNKVLHGKEWNLNPIRDIVNSRELTIDDQPRVIFCEELPDWKLLSPKEWLDQQPDNKDRSNAVVPVMENR